MNGAQVKLATIDAAFMNELQARVFEIYVGLGPERTLQDLQKECTRLGITVSIHQLKRWSAEFKWTELAQRTSEKIAEKLAEKMLPFHVARAARDLQTINTLKERFYARAALDPTDQALSDAERARALDIDLAEFLQLLKMEAFLTGDPTEIHKHEHTLKLENEVKLSDEELEAALRFAAARRHGLPPPEKNVTPEANAG